MFFKAHSLVKNNQIVVEDDFIFSFLNSKLIWSSSNIGKQFVIDLSACFPALHVVCIIVGKCFFWILGVNMFCVRACMIALQLCRYVFLSVYLCVCQWCVAALRFNIYNIHTYILHIHLFMYVENIKSR